MTEDFASPADLRDDSPPSSKSDDQGPSKTDPVSYKIVILGEAQEDVP